MQDKSSEVYHLQSNLALKDGLSDASVHTEPLSIIMAAEVVILLKIELMIVMPKDILCLKMISVLHYSFTSPSANISKMLIRRLKEVLLGTRAAQYEKYS